MSCKLIGYIKACMCFCTDLECNCKYSREWKGFQTKDVEENETCFILNIPYLPKCRMTLIWGYPQIKTHLQRKNVFINFQGSPSDRTSTEKCCTVSCSTYTKHVTIYLYQLVSLSPPLLFLQCPSSYPCLPHTHSFHFHPLHYHSTTYHQTHRFIVVGTQNFNPFTVTSSEMYCHVHRQRRVMLAFLIPSGVKALSPPQNHSWDTCFRWCLTTNNACRCESVLPGVTKMSVFFEMMVTFVSNVHPLAPEVT